MFMVTHEIKIEFLLTVGVGWGHPLATMSIAQLTICLTWPPDFVCGFELWLWEDFVFWFVGNWACPLCSGCHDITPFVVHWLWVWVVSLDFVIPCWALEGATSTLDFNFNLVIHEPNWNWLQHGLVFAYVYSTLTSTHINSTYYGMCSVLGDLT